LCPDVWNDRPYSDLPAFRRGVNSALCCEPVENSRFRLVSVIRLNLGETSEGIEHEQVVHGYRSYRKTERTWLRPSASRDQVRGPVVWPRFRSHRLQWPTTPRPTCPNKSLFLLRIEASGGTFKSFEAHEMKTNAGRWSVCVPPGSYIASMVKAPQMIRRETTATSQSAGTDQRRRCPEGADPNDHSYLRLS